MSKQLNPFIFLLAILFLSEIALGRIHHKCRHDQMFKDYEAPKFKITSFEKHFRKSAQTTLMPIRIVIDYSNLKLTGIIREKFIKIMEITRDFFMKRIKILSTGRNTVLPSALNNCVKASVPNLHRTTGFAGDLIIYASCEKETDGTAAWANFCYQDPSNGRPAAGHIHFGLDTISKIQTAKDFQDVLGIAIHELTHVLVFHNALYNDFRVAFGSNTKVASEKSVANKVKINMRLRHAIVTPRVVEFARNFFKCPSIEGAELENEGSVGSAGTHWEKSIFHNEMMGAQTMEEESFSGLTMAFLEDSGWYKVDFGLAEPLFFGKGAGCAFYDRASCFPEHHPGRLEWCNPDLTEPMCSLTGRFRGNCDTNKFSSCCYYTSPSSFDFCEDKDSRMSAFKKSFEHYGRNSRCLIADVTERSINYSKNTYCVQFTCNREKTRINFTISNQTISCEKAGQNLTLSRPLSGSIICPDPEIYCENWSCAKDCSKNGYCNKKGCECLQGWEGEDCSIRTNKSTVPTVTDPCKTVVCTGNRFCQEGKCVCQQGFVGPNCQNLCLNNCSGKGQCLMSNCLCDFGYSGKDCSVKEYCDKRCSDRGHCYKDKCYCLQGFSGSNCEIVSAGYNSSSSCPKNCNKIIQQGFCISARRTNRDPLTYSCKCWDGFLMPDCSAPPVANSGCKANCGKKGTCVNGQCKCELGFFGDDCSHRGCIDDCGGRGNCTLQTSGDPRNPIHRRYCNCTDGTQGMYCPPKA